MNEGRIINPENPGIMVTAIQIAKLLYDEYEIAPDDDRIQEFLFPDDENMNFFAYRNILTWFHFQSYLNIFNIDTLDQQIENILETDRSDSEKNILAYSVELELCLKSPNKMLALTSPEWLSKIIPENHPLYSVYNDVKTKDYTYYLFKKEDEKYMYITDSEADEEFAVNKESINTKSIGKLTADESMLMLMLVYYNNEWWQCGMLTVVPKDNVPENETRHNKEKEKAYNDFVLASKGKPFLYFTSKKELLNFFENEMKYTVNEDLQLPEHVRDKIFITATPSEGLLILGNDIECIKDPENPFYDQKIAEKDAINFLVVPNFGPYEVVRKLVDNNLLPDARLNSIHGEERGKELVADNRDFFMRYYLGKYK